MKKIQYVTEVRNTTVLHARLELVSGSFCNWAVKGNLQHLDVLPATAFLVSMEMTPRIHAAISQTGTTVCFLREQYICEQVHYLARLVCRVYHRSLQACSGDRSRIAVSCDGARQWLFPRVMLQGSSLMSMRASIRDMCFAGQYLWRPIHGSLNEVSASLAPAVMHRHVTYPLLCCYIQRAPMRAVRWRCCSGSSVNFTILGAVRMHKLQCALTG